MKTCLKVGFFASRKAIDRNCWTLKKMKFCSKELLKLK